MYCMYWSWLFRSLQFQYCLLSYIYYTKIFNTNVQSLLAFVTTVKRMYSRTSIFNGT